MPTDTPELVNFGYDGPTGNWTTGSNGSDG